MTRIHELIVYRNFENGQILEDMAWIFDHAGSEYYNEEDLRGLTMSAFTAWWIWQAPMASREISGTPI